MIITVKNSAPFQILTSAMVIGPSQTGYQLEVAADGRNFSPLFSVGPNVTRQATNLSSGAYYRLNGNVGDVVVNWRTSCVTEGGGSGSGTELTPVAEFPLGAAEGTVVALASGDTVGLYQYDGQNWNEIGGVDTEEIELPIAAAVNELKSNFEARLDQQYYKKAEVNDIAARKVEAGQVDAQIKDYVEPAIAEVNDNIEDKELATSAALNDLNTATVKSTVVKNIWSGTQSEYDAIVEKDPATLYIINN